MKTKTHQIILIFKRLVFRDKKGQQSEKKNKNYTEKLRLFDRVLN